MNFIFENFINVLTLVQYKQNEAHRTPLTDQTAPIRTIWLKSMHYAILFASFDALITSLIFKKIWIKLSFLTHISAFVVITFPVYRSIISGALYDIVVYLEMKSGYTIATLSAVELKRLSSADFFVAS